MNICRITKITQDGKPWGDPPNGPYYPFYIVFADGTTGQANAKTNPPAYKEGDEVGYEVTGATPRGVTKLKIDRRADPAHCRNTTPQDRHPDLEAADPIQTPPLPLKTPQFGRKQPCRAFWGTRSGQGGHYRYGDEGRYGRLAGDTWGKRGGVECGRNLIREGRNHPNRRNLARGGPPLQLPRGPRHR